MTVLKIEKLNKKYDNKQVLFNINIDVEEKDFLPSLVILVLVNQHLLSVWI